MDRLLFAIENFNWISEVADMYPAFGSVLHRGLDGNTHTLDLIITKAVSGRKGSQILGRILIRSMH